MESWVYALYEWPDKHPVTLAWFVSRIFADFRLNRCRFLPVAELMVKLTPACQHYSEKVGSRKIAAQCPRCGTCIRMELPGGTRRSRKGPGSGAAVSGRHVGRMDRCGRKLLPPSALRSLDGGKRPVAACSCVLCALLLTSPKRVLPGAKTAEDELRPAARPASWAEVVQAALPGLLSPPSQGCRPAAVPGTPSRPQRRAMSVRGSKPW